jgi:hypothetical protein
MHSDRHGIAQNEHEGGSHTLVTCEPVIEAGTFVGAGTVTGFFTGRPPVSRHDVGAGALTRADPRQLWTLPSPSGRRSSWLTVTLV